MSVKIIRNNLNFVCEEWNLVGDCILNPIFIGTDGDIFGTPTDALGIIARDNVAALDGSR